MGLTFLGANIRTMESTPKCKALRHISAFFLCYLFCSRMRGRAAEAVPRITKKWAQVKQEMKGMRYRMLARPVLDLSVGQSVSQTISRSVSPPSSQSVGQSVRQIPCGMKFSRDLTFANFADFSSIRENLIPEKINSRWKKIPANLLHVFRLLNLRKRYYTGPSSLQLQQNE